MNKTHPAYQYCIGVTTGEIVAPRYVKLQCSEFLQIAKGKSKDYMLSGSKLQLLDDVLGLMIMAKGLKAGQTVKETLSGFQWLFLVAVLCTVYRDDHERRRYQTAILEICRKNGKALSLDTPIPTPDGWKTMADINVGDLVYSVDGTPSEVLATSPIFRKKMYAVTFEDGETIKASADHLWTVVSKTSRATMRTFPTKRIGNGKKYRENGEYEATTEEISKGFARKRKDGKGMEYKYRVPVCLPVQYERKELPLDPYFLGVWLGDGASRCTDITVSEADSEEMKALIEACGYQTYIKTNGDRAPSLVVGGGIQGKKGSNPVKNGLRQLGLIQNKHIPDIYMQASENQRFELLRGLMDTDGTCEKGGQCVFTQKNRDLAEQTAELIRSLGIKCKITQKTAKINGKPCGEVSQVSFFTSKDRSCFKMKRKHNRLKDKLSDRMRYKSIVNVEEIPIEPSKCLMIDHPSHLYLAGRAYTPTHNTMLIGVVFLVLLLTEPRFSKFYSVAPDGSLSREVKTAIEEIIKSSPALNSKYKGKDKFRLLRDSVQFTVKETKYIPLNYSNSTLDGRLPAAFLVDETGALPNAYALEAMRSGQLTIKNKLGCVISTKYPKAVNPFEDEIAYAKKILDGVVDDDTVFALLYEPDDPTDWMTDDRILMHGNPLALDVPEIWDDLLQKRAAAIEVEARRENFLCKHCNILYQGAGTETYIPVEDVMRCRGDIDWAGREVYLGVDLSMTNDNTAVAMVSYDEATDKILADVVGFVPEGRIDEKNRVEKIDYRKYIKDGHCVACGDRTIDYGEVERYVLDIEEKYGVTVCGIGFDRYNCLSSAQKWEEAGLPCTEVKQHSSVLHPATKWLSEMVIDGNFVYEENELLEINFENARCTYDTNMNRYVTKKKSTGKVDMVVALINAVYMLQQNTIFGDMLDWAVQII